MPAKLLKQMKRGFKPCPYEAKRWDKIVYLTEKKTTIHQCIAMFTSNVEHLDPMKLTYIFHNI